MQLGSCYRYLIPMFALLATALAPAQGPDVKYTVTAETAQVTPGSTVRAVASFSLGDGWHVNAHEPLDKFLIPTEISLEENGTVSLTEAAYPAHKLFTVAGDELAVYEHEFNIGLVLAIAADAPAGELTVNGTLRYQACDDKQCMPPDNLDMTFTLTVGDDQTAVDPELFASVTWPGDTADDGTTETPAMETTATEATEEATVKPETGDWKSLAEDFTVIGRTGFEDSDAFLAFLEQGLTGEVSETDDSVFANKSWGLILLLIVVGGLALNLTPCVLPLIPVNIAIIGAGTKAGSRGRGFALGSAYGIGISLVYGLLGLAVMLSFASAFGTINATPWFNGLIALLFVVLGLAMFDIIHIDFTRFQTKLGIKKNENGSFLVAFGMGCVSALLAGACVAPVVISTILFAQDSYSQGNTFALALPFLLGVGMALPWPLVGAGLSVLPKPGMWMVRVKQAFGVFIIAFAAYYGYLAFTLMRVDTTIDVGQQDGWYTSLEEGLAEAKATGKPVLLDFWATWCKNCLVMDDTTLKDEAVVEKMESFVKIKYQAERMDKSPAKEVTEYFDVLGLPAYLILQPSDE